MARTGIYTTLGDTALGNQSTSDGIALLACPATAQTASGGLQFELDTAYLITSLSELTALGVTQAVNPKLVFNVTEFFDKAGNGSRLWVVGFADTAAAAGTFLDTTLSEVVQSTARMNFDNRPRIMGVVTNIAWMASGTNVLPDELVVLLNKLELSLESLFNDSYRMCAILDVGALKCATATGLVSEQIATTLTDASTLNAPRVGIQLTTSTAGQSASVGQTLGLMATIGLSTSIGAMTLGSVAPIGYFLDSYQNAYVNNPVTALTRAKFDTLGSYQYLFTRPRVQKSGIYYNDGATCNLATNALSSLEFLRVGNAVCDSVEGYFVDLINTSIPTTFAGEIDPAYKATTIDDLYERFLRPRINRGEAQEIQVDFWAKDGNYLSSRAIEVQVKVLPNASLREVYITTFFVTSLE